MYCPKWGNNVDLFADKCLSCGRSFKSLSLAQRKKLEQKPQKKNRVTDVRIEYNNGIPCKEGMAYNGKKPKKGSHTSRDGSRFAGYGINNAVRMAWYQDEKVISDDDRIIMDYDTKKRLNRKVLGDTEEEED